MPPSALEQLLALQREQLAVLREQRSDAEAQRKSAELQMNAIEIQITEGRAENSNRLHTIDTRLSRVEGSLDVSIAHQQHTSTMVAGLESRAVGQDKRLSDVAHRTIKVEDGVAAIAAQTERIQARCAAHDERLHNLSEGFSDLKDRIDDHETEGDQQFKEVSGELRMVERDVRGRIVEVNGDTKILRTKVDQTWKVIAIVAGGMAVLGGLILGLIKLLGVE
jgi:chromosome segregation ATPase